MPFSSRQRFGAQPIGGIGYVRGAPEHFRLDRLTGDAERAAVEGGACSTSASPRRSSRPRPEARETVAFFRRQAVELRVLSGDRLETVAAIARDVGIDGPACDGSTLPESLPELLQPALGHVAIGRVSPQGKRRVVEALRDEER